MKLQKVSLDLLVEDKINIRTVAEKEKLEELAASIKKIGVIEPLLVRKEDHKYKIIAGWRRYQAAKLAELAAVPCLVLSSKDPDDVSVRVHENIFREDVSDVDQGRYFSYLMNQKGFSVDHIAALVNKSYNYVLQRLNLLGKDPDVLAAIEGNQISFTVAREILGIDDPRTRKYYLRLAIENGATAKTVSSWKRSLRDSEARPREEVSRSVVSSGSEGEKDIETECFVCRKSTRTDKLVGVRICEACWDAIAKEKQKREVGVE